MTSNNDLHALDAYIESVRQMPNISGAAVRAIDAAEGLSPLAQYAIAPDALRAARSGESEQAYIRRKVLDSPAGPHAIMGAIAALKRQGVWPW